MRRHIPLILTALAIACGRTAPTAPSPPAPPPPPPPPVALVCPDDLVAESIDGDPIAVDWALPATDVSGARVESACRPEPGSTFAPGRTEVTCSRVDRPSPDASCTFVVTVEVAPPPPPAPRTTTPTILAFGDSLTQGFVGPSRTLVEPASAYPTQLRRRLRQRYVDQEVHVVNAGVGGESSSDGASRLAGVVEARQPDLVLLLEGTNDLTLAALLLNDTGAPIPFESIAGNLSSMIRAAQVRGALVLIATLPPVSASREAETPGLAAAIVELNGRIHGLAAALGIGPPIDLHLAFTREPDLLSLDGLHPTAAGYERIAALFFRAIRGRFEESPSAGARPGFP